MPEMFDNNSIEQWAAEGSVEINERALKRARDLLSEYEEPKLDARSMNSCWITSHAVNAKFQLPTR